MRVGLSRGGFGPPYVCLTPRIGGGIKQLPWAIRKQEYGGDLIMLRNQCTWLVRLGCLVGFLVALVAGRAAAQNSGNSSPKKIASVEGITEYHLGNGLRVLLYPDQSRPRVTVNMTVLVGSRHEGYGETGMAHLLEHMVFKGTPTHPNVPKALQEYGAQWNGTTSEDRTNYFETVPAGDKNLEFAIRLEADRLVNSHVKREDLLSEMTVVRNEFERSENDPSSVLYKRIIAAAFEWHNYGKTTIGNRSDIERVPIENLQAFYRKHYQPDNVVLIVAGQFEEAKALELIQKYFGAIPRPERKLDTTYTEEPAQDGERLVTLRRVTWAQWAWPTTYPRGRTRIRPRLRCWPIFSTRRRPAGCTRRWWKRRRRQVFLRTPMARTTLACF
jgi:secreted Zn-dependent insulinase-like peptidase